MRENDRLVEKTKQLYENRLNWDNEFIVRFKLDNNETLKCIPLLLAVRAREIEINEEIEEKSKHKKCSSLSNIISIF